MPNQNSLILYPGNGEDLIPFLLRDLPKDRKDSEHVFIYCDPAEHTQSFYEDFLNQCGGTLNKRAVARYNSDYLYFILNLDFDYLIIRSAERFSEPIEWYKFEFEVIYKTGDTQTSNLYYFPYRLETYINEIHEQYFSNRKIETVIHVTQTTIQSRLKEHQLNTRNYLSLLSKHPILSHVKFIVTDMPQNYRSTKFTNQIGDTYIGWGYSGNSFMSKASARVLGTDEALNKNLPFGHVEQIPVQTKRSERMANIKSQLKKLKFE